MNLRRPKSDKQSSNAPENERIIKLLGAYCLHGKAFGFACLRVQLKAKSVSALCEEWEGVRLRAVVSVREVQAPKVKKMEPKEAKEDEELWEEEKAEKEEE